ncbi:MAG TPA: hypothetical protein VN775_13370 [Opitutaceae bacterium]|nr:hypothetical protein [Opitutaceae bacterium]
MVPNHLHLQNVGRTHKDRSHREPNSHLVQTGSQLSNPDSRVGVRPPEHLR